MLIDTVVVTLPLLAWLPIGQTGSTETTASHDRPDHVVRSALEQLGLTPQDVRIRLTDLNTFDHQPRRLPIVEWALENPLSTPLLADYVAAAFRVESVADNVGALSQLSRWLGCTVRRNLIGDPLEAARELAGKRDSLVHAVARLHTLGGQELTETQRQILKRKCGRLPTELTEAIALLVYVMADAQEWADMAFENRDDKSWARILTVLRRPNDEEPADETLSSMERYREFHEVTTTLRSFDSSLLFVGAEEIVLAVHEVRPVLEQFSTAPTTQTTLRIDTPLGDIDIGRIQKAERDSAALLAIDFRGDDLWHYAGSNRPPVGRVSVAIDVEGNDRYIAPDGAVGSFGSGHCGIGMLFDFAGDDRYECQLQGQATALFGIGLLYDESGDDEYVVVDHGQAAAQAGAAMLVDVAGHDRYHGYTLVQGFAGPGGAAALVDLAGDDRYIADDSDIRYPSAQSAEHNNSLAQGAGLGTRGDYREGLSACGGVGLLYDRSGSDQYSAGVFAQGVGYWFGLGMLIDGGGGDAYTGHWYVQGASAHFAAGILLDRSGDDRYRAAMNMAMGAGHDIGIGVLVDDEGDDIYDAPGLSLGAGNAAGLGWFLDRTGRDTYRTSARNNLGWASPNRTGTLRAAIPAVGVFMDLAGADTYPDGHGSNGEQWGSTPDVPGGVRSGVARAIDWGTEQVDPDR